MEDNKKALLSQKILSLIDESVKRTMTAMIAERSMQTNDAYKQTLARLDALEAISARLEDNKAKLEAMREEGQLQGKSKSIIRFSAPGLRADPQEMFEAVCQSLEAYIAADQQEVDEMEKALEYISNDQYYPVISERYFNGKTDEEIAGILYCDDSTVRRNRSRLVHRLSIRLYGVQALN